MYAIIAFISVPLTFFSIRIFRTIHPVVAGTNDPGAAGSFNMTSQMSQTFMISLLWHRIRLGRLGEPVEQLKLKVLK